MRKRFVRRLVILLGAFTIFMTANAAPSYACCCVPHDVCDVVGC